MSDPQANLEIEDVLSSIRRLVSQEATQPFRRLVADSEPQPAEVDRGIQSSAAEPPDPKAADCLVLTPALRIEPRGAVEHGGKAVAHGEAHDARASETGLPAGDEADLGAELSRLEDTIAELEAAVADSGAEFEPEEGEKLEYGDGEAFEMLPETFEAFADDADDVEDTDDADEAEEASEARLFDVPHAAEEDPSASAVPQDPPSTVSEAPEIPEATGERYLEEAEAGQQIAREDLSEMATEETHAGERAPVPSRLHLGGEIGVSSRPKIHRTTSVAEPRERDDGGDAFALTPRNQIDEEVLEALVSDIIRKELQGALGERITRSVRKLVRREINRALTDQDFN